MGTQLRRAGRIGRRFVAFVLKAACVLAVLVLLLMGVGPRSGRYRVLTVLSGSMEPTLPVGGLVVVTPEPVNSVRKGQVITFARPLADQAIVTHRVVRVDHEHGHPVIVTKGDANGSPDPWRAELTGTTAWQAKAVVPGAGRLFEMIRAHNVSHAGTIVVPILLALAWLAQIWFPVSENEHESHGHGQDRDRVEPATMVFRV